MKFFSVIIFLLLAISCDKKDSEPIKLNVDSCNFCKMKIADGKFGAELITEKGRVYKFDDLHCMVSFSKSDDKINAKYYYVNDFNQSNVLISAESTFYAQGGKIRSPMMGNFIATKTNSEVEKLAAEYDAKIISWSEIMK